jgi:S-adenosyl-L-methionine hydrolase (adenosine-forming)
VIRTVTLLTDFGLADPYVAELKAALLAEWSRFPDPLPLPLLVDISHAVRPGDIAGAAWLLGRVAPTFPAGAVHLAVVDPGVGSERKGIVISTEKYYFVGPDNGIFTHAAAREEVYSTFQLTEDQFYHNPVSRTFEGRDIFAPVAGWLSKGLDCARFGEPLEAFQRLPMPEPQEIRPKAWKGAVQSVDSFGNLILNFTEAHIPLDDNGYPAVVKALSPRGDITRFHRYYQEAPPGEPFLLMGSFGFYEIAVNGGSAAEALNLKRGSEVAILAR